MSNRHAQTVHDASDAALTPPSHAPFAIYGTPLPPYDADARHDGSYVPLWKQEVRDEQGRKRLHGAFTGGWSAGYFNTVGSKEGWTPATFTTSRKDRAKDRNDGKTTGQRAEDFMDDEDLADQAESQTLHVQDVFAGLGAATQKNGEQGMFGGYFISPSESMGAKLLQKMGWKQGQGIGRKVKRQARGDLQGTQHMFAPQDARIVNFKRKSDRRGIGFTENGTLENDRESGDDQVADSDSRLLQRSHDHLVKRAHMVKKTGIGVGVLNDNESDDDENPYELGPQITYNRVIGNKKRKRRGGMIVGSSSVPRTGNQTRHSNHASDTEFQKCNDGRQPIAGFVLSSQLAKMRLNTYPPPSVPHGWHPKHANTLPNPQGSTFVSTADAAKASTLDSKSRAVLLGEQQLPGKSVFDFLSSSARDRLVAATGNPSLPQALGEKLPANDEGAKTRTLWNLVPHLSKETALIAVQRGTGGWMPYSEDESKRTRYRYFIELKAGLKSALPERPSGWSIDDWGKELREFTQAAEVFKPVSQLMASRFTSSSSSPKLASDTFERSRENSRPGDEAEKAAHMDMFGPLTRSTHPFNPPRLLCKRFSVKPPAVDEESGNVSENARTADDSQVALLALHAGKTPGTDFQLPAETDRSNLASQEIDLPDANAPAPSAVNPERNQALEGEKAGEAVFRAIFGSDDEDDEL